ncbi:MAG: hypothetical protein NUW23_14465 [Firmicutes bacterium]|nr:hypothetical protein [Bacillota bacterium]
MERLTGISVPAKEAQILSGKTGDDMGQELEAQAETANRDGLSAASRPGRLYVAIDGAIMREQDA